MPLHPHVYSTEAITLRRTDFGEADRILTLFTPTYGKVRAIAKGARRTTSRLAGHLEPFTRTQLLLASGRDLDIVTQAEGRERLDALRDDVWHATAAWYLAELVDRFLEDADPHPRLYGLFVKTLRQLNEERGHARETRAGWRCATSSCTCWATWGSGPTCTTVSNCERRSGRRRTAIAPNWAARSAHPVAATPSGA